MTKAIYPGSFDPPTNGHIDVIERASRHFEAVVVGVMPNPDKKVMFSAEERVRLLQQLVAHLANVEVVRHEGLTVELARKSGAGVIVKGLRALSDLDYELQQAQMNSSMEPAIDTLFIATSPKWSFVSSSLIKTVAYYGGSVSEFVPRPVEEALRRRA
jgi:pantetheine-phosphate adenylyltransferase